MWRPFLITLASLWSTGAVAIYPEVDLRHHYFLVLKSRVKKLCLWPSLAGGGQFCDIYTYKGKGSIDSDVMTYYTGFRKEEKQFVRSVLGMSYTGLIIQSCCMPEQVSCEAINIVVLISVFIYLSVTVVLEACIHHNDQNWCGMSQSTPVNNQLDPMTDAVVHCILDCLKELWNASDVHHAFLYTTLSVQKVGIRMKLSLERSLGIQRQAFTLCH